ncbi:MAG: hypothetical protein KatS3mg031_0914 [Chitinophagales bacterium]|nr:MAG: hypothetical protein KatS3mg031_0914 [Chitinophagales bacterium]
MLILGGTVLHPIYAQHSVARKWNEALLNAIRKDYARPTVHARNLFHLSAAMYDAWAAYDSVAVPYLLGDTVGSFFCPFSGVNTPADMQAAREEAISYAAYRLLKHRFRTSPNSSLTMAAVDSLFLALGYDSSYHSTNYTDTPAALGNYIAQQYIGFGLQDGSNEQNNYANTYYQPRNPPLIPVLPGNPSIQDPNLWQPLTLDIFIDQSGNIIPGNTPEFLSPEWGDVQPFSLRDSDRTIHIRDANPYLVYLDPGPPPLLDTASGGGLSEEYKWTFALVAIWSSMLDPSDSVMWDISPGSIGNLQHYPTTIPDQRNFYDLLGGGDYSPGHSLNPKTGLPYVPQIVPRGDYTRVLAEFWADGPHSETPPGHWFTILNYVADHPLFVRKWRGRGDVIDPLEWDVKSYFTLGGAMHDAAITAWSIKGWYDYVRPISAIRYMCQQGQSSDSLLPNYSRNGIPLVPGFIELVQPGDSLAGPGNQHVNKIKLKAWRGPSYIHDPATDVAGVDWILAENWWPYQRPTFITPPFAGYISGHSTYSRTAAEVLTAITGDAYFPGGIGEFHAPKNQFLVFEDGPSVDVTLQWATYRDASDQCSLSRIFGGIHPPADDMPGRLIGMVLGPRVVEFAETYFDTRRPRVLHILPSKHLVADTDTGEASFSLAVVFNEPMDTTLTPVIAFPVENPGVSLTYHASGSRWVDDSVFRAYYDVADAELNLRDIDVKVSGARDVVANEQVDYTAMNVFSIDTKDPYITHIQTSHDTVTASLTGMGTFHVTLFFNEPMDTFFKPLVRFPAENPLGTVLTADVGASKWTDVQTFISVFDVAYVPQIIADIDVAVDICEDLAGNQLIPFYEADVFDIYIEDSATGIFRLRDKKVQVFPNPASRNNPLYVIIDEDTGERYVQFICPQGVPVFAQNLPATLQTIVVNTERCSPGVYLLRVWNNKAQQTVKVVILDD